MNPALFDLVIAYLDDIQPACDALDRALRGRRGPAASVRARVLLGGLMYLPLARLPLHLRAAADVLAHATRRQLLALGARHAPTYRQLVHAYDRWADLIDNSADPTTARANIMNLLVQAAAGDTPAPLRAVDTNYFDAHCRPVRRTDNPPAPTRIGTRGPIPAPAGVPADPDATGRIIDGNGRTKQYFGYGLVAAVRAGGDGPEVCDALAIIPAGDNDAPIGAELLIGLAAGERHGFQRAVADRGFSQQPAFLDALRQAGIPITFDLKAADRGRTGTWRGADIVDGGLYPAAMPTRLRNAERPGPGASFERRRQWQLDQQQRARWAYMQHSAATADTVRLAPPAQRGRLRCLAVARSTAYPDLTLPTCRTRHALGEGCTARTVTYPATAAPRTWQYPFWGTAEWEAIYKQRTAVERFFAHLESDAGAAWRHGRFQMRGITKVGLLLAVAVAATNLRLRQAAARAESTATRAA
jgi:hypothetical protein